MIFTFYSYKGGVGRSMAMANVAEFLSMNGLRVIMVDWDLEAPGLESFFYDDEDDRIAVQGSIGLMDLLTGYVAEHPYLAPALDDPGQDDFEALSLGLPPISTTLVPIHERSDSRSLWLLSAGLRAGDHFATYADAVKTFDWRELYLTQHGDKFFHWLRHSMLEKADVVLIDSRTGVTEMGGVATRDLADVVVAMCAPNRQNVAGLAKMLPSFCRSELIEARGRQLRTMVIPSRIDDSELAYRDEFEALFAQELVTFLPEDFTRRGTEFMDLSVPYLPKFAYREELVVDSGPRELRAAYRKLATHMALLAPRGSALYRGMQKELEAAFGILSVQDISNRPERPLYSHDRDEEIASIRAALVRSRVVVLTGLGGIGKTHLANEVTHRFADDYTFTWWIDARSDESVTRDLSELASQLGIADGDLRSLQTWLSRDDAWLLVFDNAPNLDAVQQHFPKSSGQVIITSRQSDWPLGEVMSIDPFPVDVAADFLIERTEQDDRDAATDLATALGGLPLALELACSRIVRSARTLGDYLDLFRTRFDDLVLDDPLGRSLTASYEELVKEAPAAADLLRLTAFYADAPIPRRLITGPDSLRDPLQVDDALAALRRQSLVQRDRDDLSIHRLVQRVIGALLDKEEVEVWIRVAVAATGDAIGSAPDDPAGRTTIAEVIPHAISVIDHAAGLGRHDPDAADLRDLTALSLLTTGDYDQALAVSTKTVDGGLSARQSRLTGEALLELGRPDEAIAAFELASEATADDESRGLILGRLAIAIDASGDTAQALEVAGNGVALVTTGEAKPLEQAKALADYGSVAASADRPEEGRKALEQALTIYEEQLGSHPETARTVDRLGRVLCRQGNVTDGRLLLERAVNIRRTLLGSSHPDVGRSLVALASVVEDQAASLEFLEEATDILGTRLKSGHPDLEEAQRLLSVASYEPASPTSEAGTPQTDIRPPQKLEHWIDSAKKEADRWRDRGRPEDLLLRRRGLAEAEHWLAEAPDLVDHSLRAFVEASGDARAKPRSGFLRRLITPSARPPVRGNVRYESEDELLVVVSRQLAALGYELALRTDRVWHFNSDPTDEWNQGVTMHLVPSARPTDPDNATVLGPRAAVRAVEGTSS